MTKLVDLTGKKFNRWTVLYKGKSRKDSGKIGQFRTHWICQCDCGNVKSVYANSLTSGKSKSCHCVLRHESGSSARKTMYNGYLGKAKRNKLNFEITLDDFSKITQENCYYCNKPPSNKAGSGKQYGKYIYNGIDRIDNSLGYIKTNILPCCKNCNLAKRTLSQNEFFNMIKLIYERHLK